jgi:hypothetical protein
MSLRDKCYHSQQVEIIGQVFLLLIFLISMSFTQQTFHLHKATQNMEKTFMLMNLISMALSRQCVSNQIWPHQILAAQKCYLGFILQKHLTITLMWLAFWNQNKEINSGIAPFSHFLKCAAWEEASPREQLPASSRLKITLTDLPLMRSDFEGWGRAITTLRTHVHTDNDIVRNTNLNSIY